MARPSEPPGAGAAREYLRLLDAAWSDPTGRGWAAVAAYARAHGTYESGPDEAFDGPAASPKPPKPPRGRP